MPIGRDYPRRSLHCSSQRLEACATKATGPPRRAGEVLDLHGSAVGYALDYKLSNAVADGNAEGCLPAVYEQDINLTTIVLINDASSNAELVPCGQTAARGDTGIVTLGAGNGHPSVNYRLVTRWDDQLLGGRQVEACCARRATRRHYRVAAEEFHSQGLFSALRWSATRPSGLVGWAAAAPTKQVGRIVCGGEGSCDLRSLL